MEYLSDGKIQTHVPLVRNDSSILQNPFPLIHSNPRFSCEERHSYRCNVRLLTPIQTHVPLVRNDLQPVCNMILQFIIQTHVPLVRNDQAAYK